MAGDQLLFLKLAEALGKPSKTYRAAQEGLNIPLQALEGYRQGSDIADEFRRRKLAQQSLADALGGRDIESGLLNMTGEQAAIHHPNLEIYADLEKARRSNMPKPGDSYTPEQTEAVASGDPAKLAKAFGGVVPRSAVAANTTARGVAGKNDFFNTRTGQINLQQLPSELGPNTAAGAAYQVKVAARQGKKLVAAPGPAQNISLATSDLARAVQRSAPQLDVLYGADYSKNIITRISALKQRYDANPNGPDAPKIRKALYDEFTALDQSATPFIENHLQNYNDLMTPLPEAVRQRELGNTLPDIPFSDGLTRKTYQKTARNAQGVLIGTNDNWATFEPVQQ